MITLAEQYYLDKVQEQMIAEGITDRHGDGPAYKDETHLGRAGKYALAGAAGGLVGMGLYYLWRRHKNAKAKAAAEKDPAKRAALNAKANEIKQQINKKKMEKNKARNIKQAEKGQKV